MSDTKRFPYVGPGVSPAYAKLYDLIKNTDKVLLTDEEMAAVCGETTSVGGKGYAKLCGVIKRMEKEGVVWEREAGAGCIRKLGESDKVTSAEGRKRSAHRQTKRAFVVASSVKLESLTPEQRPKANALLSQLGALALMGSSTATKKLEARQSEGIADVAAVAKLIIGEKQLAAK